MKNIKINIKMKYKTGGNEERFWEINLHFQSTYFIIGFVIRVKNHKNVLKILLKKKAIVKKTHYHLAQLLKTAPKLKSYIPSPLQEIKKNIEKTKKTEISY